MSDQTYELNKKVMNAANNVRKRVLKFAIERGGCYLGQACSSSEILTTLYMRVLNLGDSKGSMDAQPFPGVPCPENMDYQKGSLYNGPIAPEYDRFFMSPAHYACVLYCVLAECGRISHDALDYFNVDGWNMEMIGAEHSPGFENTAGSLGQTISIAAGTALTRKLNGDSGKVYVMISDGELQEGQTLEAFQCAAFHKLDNLIVYIDDNGQQVEGATKDVMNMEPLRKRLEGFNCEVVEVDGHDIDAIAEAAQVPHENKPLVVICSTSASNGMDILEKRKPYLHFVRFSGNELQEAKEYLELI